MPYQPSFQTTPHLLKVLEEIAGLSARIKDAAVGVSLIPSLQKDAAARQAHGSTAIEGNPLTLEEVKVLAEGGSLPEAKPRSIQEVLNYFAALRFVTKSAKAKEVGVRDVLKLHSIIGQKGALDRGPLGLFRPFAVRVGDHLPPPAKEVPGLMKDLLAWINGSGRALAAWELYRRQFDTYHIFAVDEVLLEDRKGYYRAFHRAQSEKHELTGWVEYIAEAANEALRRAWSRIEAVRLSTKGEQLILSPKQEKLPTLLRMGPKSIKEIQDSLG